MTEPRPIPAETAVDDEMAATLRHDLVNPINLIVGYTDLLLSDLVEAGRTDEQAPLESIRDCGFLLLQLIDHALLAENLGRSAADIEELGRSLSGPTTLLIRECDDLMRSATGSSDGGSPAEATQFADDVRKIRSAGLRMQELAESLHLARSADAGPGPA